MKLVQVTYVFDGTLASPDALLDRYHTLTGWSEAAREAGLSVSVVQAFTRDARLHRGGVDYRFCRQGRSGSIAVRSLHDAVIACRPDVVHVNGLDAPVQTWRLRRSLPATVALVVQDHAGAPGGRFSLKAPLRRHAMQAADAYLFTSRAQAEPWINRGFIRDATRVYDVLEASTRMQPVDRLTAREVSGIAGAPAVLWVGRLDANKDPLTVLDGFERAAPALPDAALTMVFDGDGLLPAVRQRIAQSAVLAGRVRLAGRVPHAQLVAWYSAADLFVLGSRYEGSGYALIEATACGALPVVTDIAPFRAITGDGAAGLHWAVGDGRSCARALMDAGSRDLPSARRQVREHFVRHLSWDAVGRRALAIYEAVVGGRRAGRAPTGA